MTDAALAILDQDDLFIPLPDGTRLAARLWRPENGQPVPAVLEFIPYRKRDNTLPRDETMHPWMAAQGYACLRVDLRGAGDSEGVFDDEYSPQELQDACDVIGWIAAQDWCTGAVGMMGKSWGAFNSLQTAALAPPALKAVIKVCGTTDRFNDDIHYKGGCMLGENFGWGTLMLSYSARPADPLLRPDWRQDLRRRVETMPHLSEIWMSHQTRDAYWKHGSVCENWDAIKPAVLTIGGWNDGYMNAPARLVQNTRVAKALVGPWVHQYPHTAVPGPAIDWLGEMKRWWDHWLKGIDTGIDTGADALPDYRVYMLDSAPPNASAAHRPGRWLAETLPSPRVTEQTLSLGAGGVLGGRDAPDAVIDTPQTLGAMGGEYFPMGLNGEMPGDQSGDDALSVCFERPCPDGLALMGAARLALRVTPNAEHGFIMARLCDVAPNGQSVLIAHGVLNLRHRTDPPQPLTPGAPHDVVITLDQMAYRLAPAHRLRLALSNTSWPFVWPSPVAVSLRVTAGSLTLPVHDDTAQEISFDPPLPVAPSRLERLTPASASREQRIDQITGAQHIRITDDSGRMRNPDHGLETHTKMVEDWRIAPDDPHSATCDIAWDQHFSRGDWSVVTRVEARKTVDQAHFHLHATLTVKISEPGTQPETLTRIFAAKVARAQV